MSPAHSFSLTLLRTQTDARLLALARSGSEPAFEAIVERYRRPLLRACRRIAGDARGEDAVQQAFMAAWRALQRGDEVRELRPWLHRIAHNTALNVRRSPGYDFEELADSLAGSEGPAEEAERKAVMRETLTSLAALPERQRDVLLQTAVEGRSQHEVAVELGLSEGAVRQLVHRARVTLRAAATAITPLPVVTWLASAATRAEPVSSRIAELAMGGGAAAGGILAAKVATVAVVAGGVAGGPAIVDRIEHSDARPPQARVSAPAQPAGQVAAPAGAVAPASAPVDPASGDDDRGGERRRGRSAGDDGRRRRGRSEGSDGDDRSGPSGGDEDRSDSSGPGPGPSSGSGSRGDDAPSDSSGPGSADDSSGSGSGSSGSGRSGSGSGSDDPVPEPRTDSSGPGSGETDSSGSGSSGSSGSGSSGSNSGPGSRDPVPVTPTPTPDSSGSGSSGSGSSGSGSSGSGSSGSGSSGSGSSGSGSDDPEGG